MSSDGKYDVEFNEMLDEKLGNLLDLPLEGIKEGIQEARILLQKRNQRRCLSLTEEFGKMPAEMRCEVFGHFSDSALIDNIIAFPEFESTAGYKLKRREHVAHLEVGLYDGVSFGDDNIELQMQCRITKDREKAVYAPDKSIWKKHRFSADVHLSNYFCGFLRVMLMFMTSSVDRGIDHIDCKKLYPMKYFGPATKNKAKCGFISITDSCCEMFAPFLQWISPSKLTFFGDPKFLFDSEGDLMIDGVDVLQGEFLDELSVDEGHIWNDVMEKCKIPLIRLSPDTFWSRSSFFAVLSEHANSGESGVARVIEMGELSRNRWHIGSGSADEGAEEPPVYDYELLSTWLKRYEDWRSDHVSKFGEPGRNVTYDVEIIDYYRFIFKLILH